MDELLTGWWRRRGRPERFDLYTRLPLYLVSSCQPVFVASMVEPGRLGGSTLTVLGLATVHAVLNVVLVHTGLRHSLGRGPRPDRWIAASAGLALLAGVLSAALLDRVRPPLEPAEVVAVPLFAFAVPAFAALAVMIAMRALIIGGAVLVLLSGVLVHQAGAPAASATAIPVGVAAAVVGIAGMYRGSAWMLSIVWELDRARQVQADLAVAEERLRFARDLHDVVGRNLSVVAVKSELAAQLAKRGHEGAVDEMLAVRAIAQQSLIELREVVRGYRAADLGTELAGARAVLASAGVECRIVGDGAGLPPELQSALGWAVREGVTNVLRHSEATTCTVTVRQAPHSVQLIMENDGVAQRADGPSGMGLLGLGERVAPFGGTVQGRSSPAGRFTLRVELPR